MIKSLTVDVAALQRLPETLPLGPNFVEGGLCALGTCVALTQCLALSCALVGATCGAGTQGSPPE